MSNNPTTIQVTDTQNVVVDNGPNSVTINATPSNYIINVSSPDNVVISQPITSSVQNITSASTPATITLFSNNTMIEAADGNYVSSILNMDGTLVISPNTGVVTASIPSNVNLPGYPTTTTAASGDNSTKIATTAFVQSAISKPSDSSGVNPFYYEYYGGL